MRARLWLRIASVFVFLFFLGHTAAVLIPQPSSGPAEDAAVGAMKAFHFDAMGVRSDALELLGRLQLHA